MADNGNDETFYPELSYIAEYLAEHHWPPITPPLEPQYGGKLPNNVQEAGILVYVDSNNTESCKPKESSQSSDEYLDSDGNSTPTELQDGNEVDGYFGALPNQDVLQSGSSGHGHGEQFSLVDESSADPTNGNKDPFLENLMALAKEAQKMQAGYSAMLSQLEQLEGGNVVVDDGHPPSEKNSETSKAWDETVE